MAYSELPLVVVICFQFSIFEPLDTTIVRTGGIGKVL